MTVDRKGGGLRYCAGSSATASTAQRCDGSVSAWIGPGKFMVTFGFNWNLAHEVLLLSTCYRRMSYEALWWRREVFQEAHARKLRL